MFSFFKKKIMAKKKPTIEVEREVVTVVDETKVENKKNDKLTDLSLTDLVYIEKSIKVVCQRYENSIKNYDGSISHNTPNYKKFQLFNELHHKVLNKMEEKLMELI